MVYRMGLVCILPCIYYNRSDFTAYRLRSQNDGLSHGLKIARQLSIFTPVCALVSPFRVPPAQRAK